MAQKKDDAGQTHIEDIRHNGEKRKNIPPARIAAEGQSPKIPKARYYYSPHLPPVLRSDPTGRADRLPTLIADAGRRPLTSEEQKTLAEALLNHQPWLEWTTKREQHESGFFETDPVVLHIHERVSAKAILRVAEREDTQRDLFADPQQEYRQAVQFYQHNVDWANRLILGDSFQVMSSLAKRENLAGKVQMIYMDPPYGIKFASNFQPEVGRREVKDKEQDLTREPEMVKAYRDTWCLGIHSYLSYLRDRLIVAKDLLTDSGSIFVQISNENLHRVRNLLDEVFGPENFCLMVVFRKTTGKASGLVDSTCDFLLWYAKEKTLVKCNSLYLRRRPSDDFNYRFLLGPDGEISELKGEDLGRVDESVGSGKLFAPNPLTSQSASQTTLYPFMFRNMEFRPGKGGWKTNLAGMNRLMGANRLMGIGNTLRFIRFFDDFAVQPQNDIWDDTRQSGFGTSKVYVVQTSGRAIERCMLMTTDPGDLVLDPTCGSGTTAFVAEQWGRRWITIDTSRVAIAIARQRLLTTKYEMYSMHDKTKGLSANFKYKTVPHVTLRSIVRNANLDPILDKHGQVLDQCLANCNMVLAGVTDEVRLKLQGKVTAKVSRYGKRGLTDGDQRRWNLPRKCSKWEHWQVPFDIDPCWPKELQDAVIAYRTAWRAKMGEVDACIAANADQEELIDQPEIVRDVLRVSGPFTVEGVRPEELSIGEEGLFDGTPNTFEEDAPTEDPRGDLTNLRAYLATMVQYLRADGVTFLGNKNRKFARVEPLFEEATGSVLHAEALWADSDGHGPNTIAIGFGPQYGPVTAEQIEDLIRASKRYDELVVAGFSFTPEATAAIQEAQHPKLRLHQAYIRPDISPGMEGLLKETPNSQLFTVFGQPEVEVYKDKEGNYTCELLGVDIYDPVTSTVCSSGASKVAAWFLDSDFDGRCFCITQAFFPDQDAWEKIAKALKGVADPDVFDAFKGTVSVPFGLGKHKRIAVKVIDPRGNEVMTIKQLQD